MAILIIDDVPVTRKIIESFLKDGGHTDIIQAESAENAFHLLGQETVPCGQVPVCPASLDLEKDIHGRVLEAVLIKGRGRAADLVQSIVRICRVILDLVGSLLRLPRIGECGFTPFLDHGKNQIGDPAEQYDLEQPEPASPQTASCPAEAQAAEKHAA